MSTTGSVSEWIEGRKTGDSSATTHLWNRYHPNLLRFARYRLVMEAMLGRLLAPHEIVHHINGKRDDNRPENLQLVQSLPEHMALHRARGGP